MVIVWILTFARATRTCLFSTHSEVLRRVGSRSRRKRKMHSERSMSEVAMWVGIYVPLDLEMYAIAPGSKAYYKNISPWTCFRLGGNIALDTIGSNKIA